MTKTQLNDVLYKKMVYAHRVYVRNVSDVILYQISEHLEQGNRIEIRGFGSWVVRKLLPMIRRNPKTGESFRKGSSKRVWFKCSPSLYGRLNNSMYVQEDRLGVMPDEPEPLIEDYESLGEAIKKSKEQEKKHD